MANQEEKKREDKKIREKVLVPVRRHETVDEEKNLENPAEKVWKLPRRWRVY